MDKQSSEPPTQVPTGEYEPWWGIPRLQVCWAVFSLLLAASSMVFYVTGPKSLLTLAGCLSGSLFAAVLIVYLGERLWQMGRRKAETGVQGHE